MHLRSLTLFGFKSFPVKTRIRFVSGISAIVGPNGCGKSNIVDAIRWVLGEQSSRILRAKSMDDVIYAGSYGKRGNFARVSLVIDNEQGLAPPEFEGIHEIEISRTLHRTGEARYQINGRNCRLKDIQYLFMDTGAGTRSYSIVDQGQVTQFVEMGPQDRHHLLEEVAGVSRFKVRRSEALRRMASTNENLQRLEDLLAEVDRNRHSLSRQAKKTQLYLDLRKRQERLEKALLFHEWRVNSQRLSSLERRRQEMQDTLKPLEAGLASAELKMEELKLELIQVEDRIHSLRQGLLEAEERLRGLRDDEKRAEKAFWAEQNRFDNAKRRLSEIHDREAMEQARHGELLEKIKKLDNQRALTSTGLNGLRQAVEEALTYTRSITKAVEGIKVELVDLAANRARFESELSALKDRKKRLERRIEERGVQLDDISLELSTLDHELKGQRKALAGYEQSLAGLKEDEMALERAVSGLKDARDSLSSKRSSREQALAKLRARLDALRSIVDSGEGYGHGASALLASGIESKGVVANLIHPKDGYEDIVEAALGTLVQSVVLCRWQGLYQAVEFLRTHGKGRVGMVIAGHGPSPSEVVPQRFPGAVSLLELVTPAKEVSPQVLSALSRWYLVDSLDDAFRLREEGATGVFFITPSQEIFTPWFEVITGDSGDSRPGILARNAEIRRLSRDLREMRGDLEVIVGQQEKVLKELDHDLARLKIIISRKEGLLKKALATKEGIRALKLKHGALLDRQESIGLEVEELRQELSEIVPSISELQEKVEDMRARQQNAEGRLKGRENALTQQRAVLARRRDRLKDAEVELARIEATLKAQKNEKLRLASRLEGLAQEALELEKLMEGVSKNLASSRQELKRTRQKRIAQEKVVAQGQASLQDEEEVARNIKERQKETGEEIRSLNVQYKRLIAQVHEIDIAISEVGQSISFLDRRSLETFRTPVQELALYHRYIEEGSKEQVARELEDTNRKLDKIGAVNLTALEEFEELDARWRFLKEQRSDLVASLDDLDRAIKKIDRTCRLRLKEALSKVNESLSRVFPLLFEGGRGELVLTDERDVLASGVEYMIRLPGKGIQNLNLLSGGEKAMAAMALIFAIYFIKPSPFCLLDEVDAPLDEANTIKFNRLLRRISSESQVIVITHNQRVMETADTLYGVTMEEKGISKLVSVDLVEAGR